jgi:hypothetical protein
MQEIVDLRLCEGSERTVGEIRVTPGPWPCSCSRAAGVTSSTGPEGEGFRAREMVGAAGSTQSGQAAHTTDFSFPFF